jgi:hypothetical protein
MAEANKRNPGKSTAKRNGVSDSAAPQGENTESTGSPEGDQREPKAKAPKSCMKCENWREVKRQMGIARILGSAVERFEDKLADQGFTPTVAEYLKLVQIEQEYERELNPPEEIRVTWVEPTTESENSK